MKNKKFGKYGSLLEISLLILSMFAFCFLISPREKMIVSAQEQVCCEKTKSGAWCQVASPEECNVSFSSTPTSCEATAFCKQGCCYESDEGLCMENTPKRVCEDAGGAWSDNSDCEIPQCQLGCCVLGIQSAYVTLQRCKKLSSFYNLQTDFRQTIANELECVTLANKVDQGACVYELDYARTCRFTTRQECNNLAKGIGGGEGLVTGNATFYKDYLCSAPELATPCAPSEQVTCIDGKDEVYFVDTCGNPANIYDSRFIQGQQGWEAYWSKVVKKENSCQLNPSLNNAAQCGNCDYFYGSICRESDNLPIDYACHNLNCGTKRNGESWCTWDEPRESVGSRYYRHICMNGEVIIEPCADFRQEICMNVTTVYEDAQGNPVEFEQAGCVVNRWADCITQIWKADCENTDRRDCVWSLSGIDDDYYVKDAVGNVIGVTEGNVACKQKYLPGFEFWNDDAQATTACSFGSTSLKVKFIKDIGTGYDWECDENCVAIKNPGDNKDDVDDFELDPDWVDKMNRVCGSFGDCGAKINFAGQAGIGEGSSFTTSLAEFFLPFIKPLAFLVSTRLNENVVSALSDGQGAALGVAGVGVIVAAAGQTGAITSASWGWGTSANPGALTVIGYAVMAYFISQMIFSLIFPEDQALTDALSAGIAAGVAIGQIGQVIGTNQAAWGWWGLGIGIAVAILTYEDEAVRYAKLECLPYEPPVGGDDCEFCNQDDRPCTEYRCKSLGQACELINVGTEEEKCAWLNPQDVESPTISPWQDALTRNYQYTDVQPRPPGYGFRIIRNEVGVSDECIKAFTPITFGINTNEPASCKIAYNHTQNFDSMNYYVGGSNTLKYNHTQPISLPGPENINAQNVVIQNDGDYTLYIRCQDANGNYNPEEYAVKFCVEKGPDVTPATIVRTSIGNGNPVRYNINSTRLEIKLNEPASCRWSKLDQSYENMDHEFDCIRADNLNDADLEMLYNCETNLTGIKNNEENVFYFRCMDQPWLAGTDKSGDRNTNTESYRFVLQGTVPLNVMEVGPTGIVEGATDFVPAYLTVETDNGYNFGDSWCQYSDTEAGNWVTMFETGTNKHSQRLDLPGGNYKYYIKCTDLGGNTDYGEVSFTIVVDKEPPAIIKVYNYEDKLTIKTEEPSTCSYNTQEDIACNFLIDEGINLPFDSSEEHSTEWQIGKTFYIKCRDDSGNEPEPNQCSAIVRPVKQ